MNFKEVSKFSFRLILSKKIRSFLVVFSVFIGTMTLSVFLSFSNGIKNALIAPILETANPNSVIVYNDYFSVSFFEFNKGKKLDEESYNIIKKIPEVEKIGRMINFSIPSSLRVWMFGLYFETDSPIFAIDSEFLGDDIDYEFKEFDLDGEKMVPVAISPRLIDAFNSSLAESVEAIPHLDNNELLNRRFQIVFGKSSIFNLKDEPIYKSAQIKSVSAKVPMLGIAIPIESANKVMEEFGEKTSSFYSKLYIEAKSPEDVIILQEKIKQMGFKAKTFQDLGNEILSLIIILKVVFLLSAFLILLVALISLFSLISVSILEQKRTIGILSSIGASRRAIFSIFAIQGLFIGLIGSITGVVAGFLISRVIDIKILSKIPDISIKPESLFPFEASSGLLIILMVLILSFVASFLPARKASKMPILRSLMD
ncbi:MAG: ABC transporter permease [Candidatus Gracilibacteria bacterium]|jgi:ABC-type lipoprotein release transport system permease subunit|nr:ABC transporter permease [Candidatus Gracilibacteria bacterium]